MAVPLKSPVVGPAAPYPRHVHLDALFPISDAGFGRNFNSNFVGNGSIASSATTSGQSLEWDVLLEAGTWRLDAITYKSVDYGIVSVQLDGVQIGTIDQYDAAGTTYNHVNTITGIVVAESGLKRLKFFRNTKNAGSSGFKISAISITLTRTGS
jgi:hypothetical protein